MKLSIIIKAYNEEHNIERAIKSSLQAVAFLGEQAEVILADSLSTDRTIDIAKQYPVKIVQLNNPSDRSCGIGAELGFQIAQGEFIYILDGDMEFVDSFLPIALNKLESEPKLAGVAGLVQEMNTTSMEFQERFIRKDSSLTVGKKICLGMGGLYKAKALEDVGYFTHQNLRSYEELELGTRLTANGWALERVDTPSVKHYGHQIEDYRLLIKRCKSGYVLGIGELLRSAFGQKHLILIIKNLNAVRLYFAYLLWMLALIVIVALVFIGHLHWLLPLIIFLAPFAGMTIRKKSIRRGVYAVIASILGSIGMTLGIFQRKQKTAITPIDYTVVQ